MESTRRGSREEVDVRQRVERGAVPADPPQQLVVLAHVPADLVDHEPRARPGLLAELEVLRHHLTLVALVVRHHAAEEEIGAVEAHVGLPGVREPVVHLGEEADEPDRVDVEDGCREALVAHDRVVARQREDVVETHRAELPATALERVSVPVLAGQVDDHLLAARDHVGAERVGREHRVPPGVVGDRQHVDARVVRQLAREVEHAARPVRRDEAAARDDLGRDDEGARPGEMLSQRCHGSGPFVPSIRRPPASASPRRTSCVRPRRTGTG